MPANCSWCIYSDTGEGKTSWIEQFALAVNQMSGGKKSRLVTTDGGGSYHLTAVRMGILDVWVVSQDARLETLELAARGYWPKDVGDPQSPILLTPLADLHKIGVYAFEGLTSMSGTLMDEVLELSALGRILGGKGEASAAGLMFTSGKTKFAGPGMREYGTVQSRTKKLVTISELLPVEHVIWTARALKSIDEGRTDPCYGPMMIGKATTPDIPGWFVHTIHLDSEEISESGKAKRVERRAYLAKHYGVNNPTIPFFANLRVPSVVSHKRPAYVVTDFTKSNTALELLLLNQKLQDEAIGLINREKTR